MSLWLTPDFSPGASARNVSLGEASCEITYMSLTCHCGYSLVQSGGIKKTNIIFGNTGTITYLCLMSKVNALYHIVFCTKKRKMTIPLEYAEDLYRFIWKEISTTGSHLIRIGGIQNHLHLLIDLHPSVALAELMRNIKGRSSVWMQSDSRFPKFTGWAAEYFASTLSPEAKNAVINYIKEQRTHHLGMHLDKEVEEMYRYAGLHYDPRDMQ